MSARNARSSNGSLPRRLLLRVVDRLHAVVEALDRDAPLPVVERREEPRERGRGVHHRAAVRPRVEVARGAVHGHLERRDPAEAVEERGNAAREPRRVRDRDRLRGREVLLVRLQVLVHDRAAALLLALDHEAQVERQRAAEALRGEHEGKGRALVVGAAAGPDLAVFHDGFERRRLPEVKGVRGLDVVVAVDDERGLLGIDDAGAVDGGEPLPLEEPRLEPRLLEPRADELRRPPRVGVVRPLRRDRRDAQVVEEQLEIPVAVLLEVAERGVHGATLARDAPRCHEAEPARGGLVYLDVMGLRGPVVVALLALGASAQEWPADLPAAGREALLRDGVWVGPRSTGRSSRRTTTRPARSS